MKTLTLKEKQDLLNKVQLSIEGLLITATIIQQKKNSKDGTTFSEKINVAEFEFYKDEHGLIWANKLVCYGIYQRIGLGSLIIKKAVALFGRIYFSTATQSEKALFSKDKENDFRYFSDAINFEESSIGLFAHALVRKGIINQTDICNPYQLNIQ